MNPPRSRPLLFSVVAVVVAALVAAEPVLGEADGRFHPLVPGIGAEPLPLDLPNCNNLLYRHDGVLVALAYRGDVYLLRDTDGDGAEDSAEVFWESKGRLAGQIGMDLAPAGSPHGNAVFLCGRGKIVLLSDRDGDDRAEEMKVLAEGWPVARGGVDVTALALDPRDGAVWFGLGVRWYNNAYELDDAGRAHYDIGGERGTILRIAPDFSSRRPVCTGIRFPIALRFNRHGDLFCTDQEGATWLPNGNPFDELHQIQPGRHYGFPPRHPHHLPEVIDEPSVYDWGPQHQSACGMNFNESVNGGPVFGPGWWAGDALVAGESRGKLYRTKLVKTPAGYVAQNEILACLGMLTIDPCVSPAGELRICTHSGPPDWGTGPEGKGKIWRVTYRPGAPQPVIAWRRGPGEVQVAFDAPLPEGWERGGTDVTALPARAGVEVRAGDRFETMRPPYEVVKRQQAKGHRPVQVRGLRLSSDRTAATLETDGVAENITIGFELPGGYALAADTSGLEATWEGPASERWKGWIPHGDLAVARALTAPSPSHQRLWTALGTGPGRLTLKTQLDLWRMLRPEVQAGAQLDYVYPPEDVTVHLAANTPTLTASAGGRALAAVTTEGVTTISFEHRTEENVPVPVEIVLDSAPGGGGSPPTLSMTWSTAEDPRPRAFPRRRFLMPWAVQAEAERTGVAARPELRGGDWARGKAVFFGAKALCSQCHQVRGEGIHLGPDLSNLPHRDYASVLRDIRDPAAAVNPDYLTAEVVLADGQTVKAVVRHNPGGTVALGVGPGAILTVPAGDVVNTNPAGGSLMPAGLDAALTAAELRDLMTFLLNAPPVMRDYPKLPRDGVDEPPRRRTRAEIDAALAGAPSPPLPVRPLRVVLVAGAKDHGFGEHDYPQWQTVWSNFLSLAEACAVETAWEWPDDAQWEGADVLVFFKKGNWTRERSARLQTYLRDGGGAVLIHWACEAGGDAPALAKVIGLASNGPTIRYRHGLVDLAFGRTGPGAPEHPVARGFSGKTVRFHDETYWRLTGDPARLDPIATAVEEGTAYPIFWSRELEAAAPADGNGRPGRVFVSIPGHYSWTFDDPLFRVLLLRGIAWSAHEPVDRFNNLVEAGVDLAP